MPGVLARPPPPYWLLSGTSTGMARIDIWPGKIQAKKRDIRLNINKNKTFFVGRIWRKFHPGAQPSSQAPNFQFTFPEFVRLVVNGTTEFADDKYILQVIANTELQFMNLTNSC